jgi:hypothetical protein
MLLELELAQRPRDPLRFGRAGLARTSLLELDKNRGLPPLEALRAPLLVEAHVLAARGLQQARPAQIE